jgi:hypothetical protein
VLTADENIDKLRSLNRRQAKQEENINWRQVAVGLLVAFALYIGFSKEIEKLTNSIDKIDKRIDYVLLQNQTYEKSIKTLNGTACASCHLEPSMMLPKSSLSMEQFTAYVRGTARFNKNSIMPKFETSQIGDAELEKIWKGLGY